MFVCLFNLLHTPNTQGCPTSVGWSMLGVLTGQFIDFAAITPVLDSLVAESVLEQVGLLERLRLWVSVSSRCFTLEGKV